MLLAVLGEFVVENELLALPFSGIGQNSAPLSTLTLAPDCSVAFDLVIPPNNGVNRRGIPGAGLLDQIFHQRGSGRPRAKNDFTFCFSGGRTFRRIVFEMKVPPAR